MTDMTVANTIVSQLTQNRPGALKAMLGTKAVVGGSNYVRFDYKGSRTANLCKIVLEGDDTYTMEFWKVRAVNIDKVNSISDVYADMLTEMFESETGLYLTFAPRR